LREAAAKMSIKITDLDNLELTQQVCTALKKNKSLKPQARKKILTTITRLNEFGTTDDNYLGAKVKNLKNGWWEIRIKHQTDEWRILFRKIGKPATYGLVYMFLKDTDAISLKDWKRAKELACSEGWL